MNLIKLGGQFMKKSKIVIILFIIGIVFVVFYFNNNKNIELKENQIQIDSRIITVTSKKDEFNQYKSNYDMSFYENNDSVEIEIRDENILTYKNIKVGDNISKLDFCDKEIGMVYYFESKYCSGKYNLEIQYGTDNKEIITITYHFY